MNNLKNNILNKIKAGEIDMKPKWHFVLQAGLLLSGVVIVALLAVYLMSFVIFFLRQSGIGFAPRFGFRGISFFVMSSPWLLIGISTAFLALLHFLVKRYSFSYQRPLLYSMIGVVVFVLLGSWFIQQTPMHQRISSFMERNEVPVFAPLYRGAKYERPEGLVVGVITEVTDTGFSLESDRDGEVSVIITDDTRMKPGTVPMRGEVVMVFGDRGGNTITAFGVRPQGGNRIKPPPRPRNQKGVKNR